MAVPEGVAPVSEVDQSTIVDANQKYAALGEMKVKEALSALFPKSAGKFDYEQLLAQYDRLQLNIAGPSGNTDLHLDTALTFRDTDLFLNFLACVVWMGNPPDHSLSEMLLATKAERYANVFSNERGYDFKESPYSFVESEIKNYVSDKLVATAAVDVKVARFTRLGI